MYYFIVNPNSRSGKGYKIWGKLEKDLISSGVHYKAYLTERTGHARLLACRLTENSCKEPKTIVAVGGDGTVNEVLDGLSLECPVTLGYIPTGSGNDLARSLKLSKKPCKVLKKILQPKYFKVLDYGVLSYGTKELQHRRFAVSCGIGLDAAVCHDIMHTNTKDMLNRLHLGKLSYIVIGLRQLVCAKTSSGYLLLDGVKKVEFGNILFASIHIHKFEGGGFMFAPQSDPCDGKLSICLVCNQSKRKMIPILLSSFWGRHTRYKGVRTYDCHEVSIHTEEPLAIHTDGECCQCETDLVCRCVGKQLRLIV